MAEYHPNTPKNDYLASLIAFYDWPSEEQFIISTSPVDHQDRVLRQPLPVYMPKINPGASTQYKTIPVKPVYLSEGV